jgi:hypothetical protein
MEPTLLEFVHELLTAYSQHSVLRVEPEESRSLLVMPGASTSGSPGFWWIDECVRERAHTRR